MSVSPRSGGRRIEDQSIVRSPPQTPTAGLRQSPGALTGANQSVGDAACASTNHKQRNGTPTSPCARNTNGNAPEVLGGISVQIQPPKDSAGPSHSPDDVNSARDVVVVGTNGGTTTRLRPSNNNSSETTTGGKNKAEDGRPGQNKKDSRTCCFCWCCCCSCSWNASNRCRSLGLAPSARTGFSSLAVKNNEGLRTIKDNNKQQQQLTTLDHFFNGDNDTPPTLDEIRTWGESFEKLMKCTAGRRVFRDFLKCEYSEENILFWLACEDLKMESNPDVIEEKARLIYEDYISILSPKEVSLDSRVREIINRNMVEPSPHTFDEAQLQIYTLMHRDSYPRFVNSTIYRKLAQLPSPSRKGSVA